MRAGQDSRRACLPRWQAIDAVDRDHVIDHVHDPVRAELAAGGTVPGGIRPEAGDRDYRPAPRRQRRWRASRPGRPCTGERTPRPTASTRSSPPAEQLGHDVIVEPRSRRPAATHSSWTVSTASASAASRTSAGACASTARSRRSSPTGTKAAASTPGESPRTAPGRRCLHAHAAHRMTSAGPNPVFRRPARRRSTKTAAVYGAERPGGGTDAGDPKGVSGPR